MVDTLTKYGTLSSVGVDKRSLKVGGGGGGLANGGSEKFVIATGVPDFRFCSSFA